MNNIQVYKLEDYKKCNEIYSLWIFNDEQLNKKTYTHEKFLLKYCIRYEDNKYILYDISNIVMTNNGLYIEPKFIQELSNDDNCLKGFKYFIIDENIDDKNCIITIFSNKDFKELFINKYKCNIDKICFPQIINNETCKDYINDKMNELQEFKNKKPWYLDSYKLISIILSLIIIILTIIQICR